MTRRSFLGRAAATVGGMAVLGAIDSAALADRVVGSSGPTISNVTGPTSAVMGQMVDIQFDVTPAGGGSYSNVFDPSVIAVDATLSTPITIPRRGTLMAFHPCFWMEDVSITPGTAGHGEHYALIGGTQHWHLRFNFLMAGTWAIELQATDAGGTTFANPPSITVTSATPALSRWGWKNGFFTYVLSGAMVSMVGNNIAVEDRDYTLDGTQGYNKYLPYIGANGGQVTRFIMDEYHRDGLEYSQFRGDGVTPVAQYSGWDNFGQGLGRYAQQNAKRVDEFLRIAGAHNVSTLLCVNNHSYFSSGSDARWVDSPYNGANGGPVTGDPAGILTNASAITYMKNRLRYCVARYAAYPAVGAWEIINEGGSVGSQFFAGNNTIANHAAWVRTMHGVLGWDGVDHLVTWSQEWEPDPFTPPNAFGGNTDPIFAQVDFACLHAYQSGPWSANNRRATASAMLADMRQRLAKPVLHTESGLYRGSPANPPEANFDPMTSGFSRADKDHLLEGTHVRQETLNALANGFTGAWNWWNGSYLAEDASKHRTSGHLPYGATSGPTYSFPLEPIYQAAAAIMAGEAPQNWPAPGIVLNAAISGAGLSINAFGYAQRALVYVADSLDAFGSGSEPGDLVGRTFAGRNLTVNGLANGSYTVEVWNTRAPGGMLSSHAATSVGGVLTTAVPTITDDAFYKIH